MEKSNWPRLLELATHEADAVIGGLRKPLRDKVMQLHVAFERVPNSEFLADGIKPDTLGLFTGAELADEVTVLPPQIHLFLENIWDYAEGDEAVFCGEVCITLLHELGHFLGLNEYDLIDRGLE